MSGHALNIIDTLDDPGLFQPWFPGPSWNAWRVILKAAFGIPLDDGELETFHALAGDRAPPDRQVRELWIIAGRRAGRDSVASVVAALLGVNAQVNQLHSNFGRLKQVITGALAVTAGVALFDVMAKLVDKTREYSDELVALQRLGGDIGNRNNRPGCRGRRTRAFRRR